MRLPVLPVGDDQGHGVMTNVPIATFSVVDQLTGVNVFVQWINGRDDVSAGGADTARLLGTTLGVEALDMIARTWIALRGDFARSP